MSLAWAVALLTLREGLRARSVHALGGLFAASMALTSFGLGPSALPEERYRALLGAAGTGTHLLLLLAAVVIGALAVPQEARRKTLLHLFSKPLPRWTYLAGKWFGASVLLLGLAGFCAAVSCAAIAVRGGAPGGRAYRTPLQPLGMAGTVGRTECLFKAGRLRPTLLTVGLDLNEPPAGLQALVSGGGKAAALPVPFTRTMEAQVPVPPLEPDGPDGKGRYRVVLNLSASSLMKGEEGVRLYAQGGAYPWLVLEAALGDWVIAATLCAMALGASTFLSAPVALFLATALAVTAHGHPLARDIEALLAKRASARMPAFALLRTLTPDLDRLDLCPCLVRAERRTGFPLGQAAWACAPYALAGLALGMAGMARSEVGR